MIVGSEEWLRKRYIEDLASKFDIANELGCSIHNVSRLTKKFGLKRGKAAQVGKKPWNYGLTKETDERVASISEKQTGEKNSMFGSEAWNKGLTKGSDDRVAEISKKLTGLSPGDDTREKMRIAKLGKTGEKANNYKRGWWLNASGYIEIKDESGRKVYLHRFVAKTALGRELRKSEHVHHLDGNKKNNDKSNLLLLNVKAHSALHAGVKFPASADEQILWLKDNKYDYILIGDL